MGSSLVWLVWLSLVVVSYWRTRKSLGVEFGPWLISACFYFSLSGMTTDTGQIFSFSDNKTVDRFGGSCLLITIRANASVGTGRLDGHLFDFFFFPLYFPVATHFQ